MADMARTPDDISWGIRLFFAGLASLVAPIVVAVFFILASIAFRATGIQHTGSFVHDLGTALAISPFVLAAAVLIGAPTSMMVGLFAVLLDLFIHNQRHRRAKLLVYGAISPAVYVLLIAAVQQLRGAGVRLPHWLGIFVGLGGGAFSTQYPASLSLAGLQGALILAAAFIPAGLASASIYGTLTRQTDSASVG
jgi:hypothetical protein